MKLRSKINLDQDRRKIWFMSDLHYNHQNILHLGSGRPFEDLASMNRYILETIKNTVGPDDILFDLGDLIWRENKELALELCENLPKESYKILGNHDAPENYISGWHKQSNFWVGVYDTLDIIVRYKEEIIRLSLSHYPILDWNHRYHGSINIHGHCHGMLDDINSKSGELRFDIGFDSRIAREVGSFLIPFEKIYDKAKEITGGELLNIWANNRYNGNNG